MRYLKSSKIMPMVKILSPVRPFSILCEDSDSVSEVIRKICRRYIVGCTASTCKLFSIPLAVLWQGFESSEATPLRADREMVGVLAELARTDVLYFTNEAVGTEKNALLLGNEPLRPYSTLVDPVECSPPVGVHQLGSKDNVELSQMCAESDIQCARNLLQPAFDTFVICSTCSSSSDCTTPLLAAVHSKIEPSLELETSNSDNGTLRLAIESDDDDVMIVGVDGPECPVTAERVTSVLRAELLRCPTSHTWDTDVVMRKLRVVFGKAVESATMRELVIRNMKTTLKTEALQSCPSAVTTIDCCGMTLTSDDLRTLEPLGWLNDQVINCYFKLLVRSSPSKAKTFAANTFFYSKLAQCGYHGIREWLKGAKVNIFRLDLVLVPVHSGVHWTLAAIHVKKRMIEYYDSLGIKNYLCLKRLQMLCAKEEYCMWKSRRKRWFRKHLCPFKPARLLRHWKVCFPKGVPIQDNWSDCGVFVCQFARLLLGESRLSQSTFPFSSRHMPLIRRTMLQELRTERLIDMNFETCTAD